MSSGSKSMKNLPELDILEISSRIGIAAKFLMPKLSFI